MTQKKKPTAAKPTALTTQDVLFHYSQTLPDGSSKTITLGGLSGRSIIRWFLWFLTTIGAGPTLKVLSADQIPALFNLLKHLL